MATMDPINYQAGLTQPTDFLRDIQGGLQVGAGLQAIQQAQQQRELAQQYQQDAAAAMRHPTPQAFSSLVLKYPAQREAIKQSWEGLSDADRKAEGSTMSQAYSALLAGKPDVAKQVVQAQIDARKNSGLDTSHYDNALSLLDADPKQAQAALGFTLANIQDPKSFATQFSSLGGEQRSAEQAPAALTTANAKASAEQADATQKQMGLIGQTMGPLAQAKNLKPEQVATAFKSLAAKGVISKDELPDYLNSIPQDAAALPDYLKTYQLAGMKPDDLMKYTAPDANTKANNETQIKTTGMNNATQLKVQDRIDARQDSKGDTEPTLDQDTLTTMAQQYLAGDKSVMQNLGRGAQGAANVVALRQAITRAAKDQGLTGPQIAAQLADYQGMTAGIRTSANISARVENAAAEAAKLAPLAVAAGREVSRSGFLPFGKVQVMFDTQTNDPKLKRFATANIGLATAYANAMARGQKATVEDNKHSRELLSTATSQPAYEAVVNQMLQEINAARQAPEEVRQSLRGQISNRGQHATVPNPVAAPAAPALPAGWTVKVH